MLKEKTYGDVPKWFHPGMGKKIQKIDSVKNIYFEDREVNVVVNGNRDTIADKIENQFEEIRISDYTEDGILLRPHF